MATLTWYVVRHAFEIFVVSLIIAGFVTVTISRMSKSPWRHALSAIVAGLLVNPVFVPAGHTAQFVPGWLLYFGDSPGWMLYGLLGGIPWGLGAFLLSVWSAERFKRRLQRPGARSLF